MNKGVSGNIKVTLNKKSKKSTFLSTQKVLHSKSTFLSTQKNTLLKKVLKKELF